MPETPLRRARLLLCLLPAVLAGCGGATAPASGPPAAPRLSVRRLFLLDPMPWSAKMLAALGQRVETAEDRAVLTVRDDTPEALARTLAGLRMRMRVITENIKNAEVARRSEAEKEPYRRRLVSVGEDGSLRIDEDPSDWRRVYRPDHPDADKEGYVRMPNVYRAVEEADLAEARREYDVAAGALGRIAPEYVIPPAASFLPVLPPETPPAAPKPTTTVPPATTVPPVTSGPPPATP